jgi:hypothetical protein
MSKTEYICMCGFKTPYINIFNIHKYKRCGAENMIEICRTRRGMALTIDKFIKILIENDEELHQSHKILNLLYETNENSLPFYVLKNISFVKGWNNLTKQKRGDNYCDSTWSVVNTTEFIDKYIEYYNANSNKKIVIDDINEYIDILVKQCYK